ncbi:MAG: lysylphosphatidylglycerol synthase transmembrane domain-containing protein [Pseudomonadota bacterium]
MTAFAFCLGGVVALFGWEDVVMLVRRLSPWHLVALCAMAGLHYLIRAARWHMLVRAHGVQSPLSQNMLHYFGGFAMTATPGRLGELVRLRWLQRLTGRRLRHLVPIALADRAIELASLLVLVLGALAFSTLGSVAVWLLVATGSTLVVVFCRPALLEQLLIGLWRALGHRAARGFAKARRVVRDLAGMMTPAVLLPVLAIGTLGWTLEGIAFWALLGWLEIPLPFATATAIFMVSILAGALSGLPGGLGGTEATGVGLLVLQGIPTEQAVISIVIIRVVTLWFAILIGLLFFPMAEARTGATPTRGTV